MHVRRFRPGGTGFASGTLAGGRGLHRRSTGRASGARSGARKLRIEGLEARQLLAVTPLIDEANVVRAIVPTQQQYNDFGLEWTDNGFDDSLWLSSNNTAPNGVGYDNPPGTTYLQFIDVNVGAAMSGISPTAFARIPFTVADPAAFNRVVLKLRYDDAFVAYINGTEVARSQTSPAGYPPRDALATAPHDQVVQLGANYAGYNLGNLAGVLQAGTNVLAIRGFNVSLSDDDFLIQATLEGQTPGAPPVAANDSLQFTKGGTQAERTVNVLLNDSTGENALSSAPIRIISQPASGTLAINQATGAIEYIPTSASFAGTDNFVYQLEDATGAVGDVVTLVNERTAVRAFIPTDATLGASWQQPGFDDAAWIAGTGYVGYDTNGAAGGDFNPFVGSGSSGASVAGMRGVNASAYARYEFTLDAATVAALDTFTMRMRFDDGFVAYLNGVQIAARNAPPTLLHTSNATTNISGNQPLTATAINDLLTDAAKGALKAGENVLAIQILNVNSPDVDALMQAELTARTRIVGAVSNAAIVSVQIDSLEPIAVNDPTPGTGQPIRAGQRVPTTIRVLDNDLPGSATNAGTPPINPATVRITRAPANGTATVNAATGVITYTSTGTFLGEDTFEYTVNDNSQRTTTKLIVASTATQGPPASPGTPSSTQWFYQDDGSDQGTNWRATTFDELGAGWKLGRGQLGYGEGDETTTVDCGPAAGNECTPTNNAQTNKYITTYFRTKFNLPAGVTPAAVQGLRLRYKRDDGLAIYVNGTEWTRDNLAANALFNQTAIAPIDVLAEDTFVTYTATPAQRAALLATGNVIAVEVHQQAAASSDLTFDLELEIDTDTGTARTSNPATVTVQVVGSNPVANNDTVTTAQGQPPININVAGNDQQGFGGPTLNLNTVAITQQPANGTVTVLTGAQAGQVQYTPNPNFAGTDTFQYTIRDNTPATAPVSRTLLPAGSTWKYLDNGSDQGTAWKATAFNDMAWAMGPAELGYGDGTEATVVSFGPNAAAKFITTYFRTSFMVVDKSKLSNLSFLLNIDDGAVIYINGTEVGRLNIPATIPVPYTYETVGAITEFPAPVDPATIAGFTWIYNAATALGALVDGNNVIAVEVHQDAPGSSDISFDVVLNALEAGIAGVTTNAATVSVDVNARPIVDNETVNVGTSQSITIPVLDGDVDPAQSFGTIGINPASVQVVQPPAGQGTVTVNPDGTVTYQAPTFNNPRQVTFTYTVADVMPGATNGRSLPGTVTVNVTVQPPTTTPDFELTPRATPVDINPIAREADTQGFFAISPTSIQISSQPTVGTAAVVNTPQGQRIRYTPPAGFTGIVTLSYTIADIHGNRSAPAVARIEVYEPAVANLDTFPTRTNTPLTLNAGQLMVNDTRIDYQAAVNLITVLDTAQGGTIVQNGASLTYTPRPGFVGIDSFVYRLVDTQVRTPVRFKNPSNDTTVEIAVGAVTVDGFVYVDLNQNGVKDIGESGVPGAMITLTRHPGGVSDRTFSTTHVTNSQGFYSFATTTGLPMVPGAYTIAETPPILFTNNAQVPANRYDRIPLAADSQNHNINFRKFGPAAPFFPFFLNYGGGFLASQQPVNLAAGSVIVPYSEWDGTFTAQASYAPGQGSVEMRLYGGSGSILATAGAATAGEAGMSQKTLSYNPAPGQPLVLVMSGNNTYVNASVPSQGESTGDVTAPLVREVVLGSTRWASGFVDHLRQAGMGDGGYSILHAGSSLPWGALDQITIRFSEDVAIGPWDLAVWGTTTLDHLTGGAAIQNFSYDPATFTASWTLNQPLAADRMRIRLSDSVMDGVGNSLAGGLDLPLAILPGDAARSGATTMASVTEVMRHMMTRAGDDDYSIYHDIDGNGRINAVDAVLVRNQLGTALPSEVPLASPVPAPSSLRASLIDRGNAGAAIREISTVAVELVPGTNEETPTPGRLRAVRTVDLALADLTSDGEASPPRPA